MDNNILKILVGLVLVYLIYKNYSNCKKIEKMSDTTNIRDEINKIYKADIQSIRNLEAISKKLQEGGLTVSGDLTVDGNIKVKKNLEVKEKTTTKMLDIPSSKGTTHFNYQNKGDNYLRSGTNFLDGFIRVNNDLAVSGRTTINRLYGGQSTGGGWRDIVVDGGHLRFVVGNNKYGFHSNNNGIHFYKGNSDKQLPIYSGIDVNGTTNLKGMLYGTNFQFHLGNQGYIKTAPNSSQLIFHGPNGCPNRQWRYFGPGAYYGNCGGIYGAVGFR